MKITQRAYSDSSDQPEMIHLARASQLTTLHVIDLPYRLSSWALDDPENACLWLDKDSRLVAWAVMQTPFWTIDYVIRPDLESELHRQILNWGDQRAQAILATRYGHSSWFVNVFADQVGRQQDLGNAGFIDQTSLVEDAWSKVWMRRDGQLEVPAYPTPAGFTMRSLAGEAEVQSYVELHRAVFGTENMTTAWRLRTLKHPDYHPDLDVVVVAPEGRLAAFCIGWLLQIANGEYHGQIEPLGCHADFRGYALGRLALCEALRRLQQYGARNIFVETDNYRNTAFRLYESLGFWLSRDVLVYGKSYNDATG